MSLVVTLRTTLLVKTLDGTDAFALVFRAEFVCVAMTAAEGEGHTATNVVIVVPSGDWNAARSWVHRQCAYTYTNTSDYHQLSGCYYRRTWSI